MNSPIEDIKRAVAENRTGDALSKLLELSKANQQLHNDLHQVFSDFNDLNSKVLRGTIDINEANRLRNIIHEKILFALNAFDSSGSVLPNRSTSVVGGQNLAFLRKWGFVALGIAILFLTLGVLFLFVIGNPDQRGFLDNTGRLFIYLSFPFGIVSLIMLRFWLISIFAKALQGK